MATATLDSPARATRERDRRRGQLALLLQEAFTVAVRLRSNRQVAADSASFRVRVKQLLGVADREARQAGYDGDSVKLAIYAYIAFLDESVLNSTQPMFADWPRQPLQEEIFGDHVAGETFYRYLQELLARQDSEELADLLEVFQLCLLIGFRGRYAADDAGLHAVLATVYQKITRCRGGLGELSPDWAPPAGEVIPVAKDRWTRRLAVTAAAGFAATLLLFLVFRLSLGSGANEVRDAVARLLG